MLKKHNVSACKNSYHLQVNFVIKSDWEVQKYNLQELRFFYYISITNVKCNHFLWYSSIDAEANFFYYGVPW